MKEEETENDKKFKKEHGELQHIIRDTMQEIIAFKGSMETTCQDLSNEVKEYFYELRSVFE